MQLIERRLQFRRVTADDDQRHAGSIESLAARMSDNRRFDVLAPVRSAHRQDVLKHLRGRLAGSGEQRIAHRNSRRQTSLWRNTDQFLKPPAHVARDRQEQIVGFEPTHAVVVGQSRGATLQIYRRQFMRDEIIDDAGVAAGAALEQPRDVDRRVGHRRQLNEPSVADVAPDVADALYSVEKPADFRCQLGKVAIDDGDKLRFESR